MFITDTDYKSLIQDEDLDLVEQSDSTMRAQMELTAIEEMSGYIRFKYDTAACFASSGSLRNKVILMYCMDITLYHLHSSVPGRVVPEIRQIRYERAVKWLEQVAAGKIQPDIPVIGGSDVDSGSPIKYGNQPGTSGW